MVADHGVGAEELGTFPSAVEEVGQQVPDEVVHDLDQKEGCRKSDSMGDTEKSYRGGKNCLPSRRNHPRTKFSVR